MNALEYAREHRSKATDALENTMALSDALGEQLAATQKRLAEAEALLRDIAEGRMTDLEAVKAAQAFLGVD